MSEGALFNSGFLGASFNWWVGQIADDSTWRDNIVSGKFESKDSVPGWGRRYKVRIIGLHDKEEETIPSDQLPWAQVMYPITAGGGQTNAAQTPNLRQGNFVFGFFLDGQDQQVPVIMGVLGNNAQTQLATKIGTTEQNFAATSGFAEGKKPPTGDAKPKVPDFGKVTTKPKSPAQSQECASPPPGVKVNQFGLRSDLSLSKEQFADQQSALSEAEGRGLTGPNKDAFVQQAVAAGIKNRCQQANSPAAPAKPGATKENPDAVHELNAADVIREEKYQEKIPLMKPDDKVGSAIKCIQTTIDKLTQKINKYLNAISSYVDAVSSKIGNLKSLIANAACEIAKYMKIVFDKIMEYVLKILNKSLTKVVSATPSSLRHQFGDLKEIITELILQSYNKITSGLCGLIQDLLNAALNPEAAERQARVNANNPSDKHTTPKVPICCAEEIIGQAISFNRQQITEVNDNILSNVNTFLQDVQNQLAEVSGALSDITYLARSINGSMSSALSFSNLICNIFSGELPPNPAISDFYIFAKGGAALPDSSTPSVKAVENAVSNPPPKIPTTTATSETSYRQPTKHTRDIVLNQ
jgi:uncharacterized protein YoxC